MKAHRMPACDCELGRFLRQPQHAIPIRNRYEQMDGGRSRDRLHVIDEHLEATLRQMYDAAETKLARSGGEAHRIASHQAAHTGMMRRSLRQRDTRSKRQCTWREECSDRA